MGIGLIMGHLTGNYGKKRFMVMSKTQKTKYEVFIDIPGF
jgi:hypothetical protein